MTFSCAYTLKNGDTCNNPAETLSEYGMVYYVHIGKNSSRLDSDHGAVHPEEVE